MRLQYGTSGQSRIRRTAQTALLLLLFKAVCFTLIFLAIFLLPFMFNARSFLGNFHWLGTYPPSLENFFETYDTQHYLLISAKGYLPGCESNKFFPLWPFMVRWFSYITGGLLVPGLLLSNILSATALTLLHGHITDTEGSRSADYTLALMLAFPGALFLLFPYSESLFLLISVLIIIFLSKNNYLWAGIACFFAVLARPVGVLWALPIAVHMLQGRRYSRLPYLLFPAAGYLCYLGIMYHYTGDALVFFHLQPHCKSHASISKLFDIPGFIRLFMGDVSLHGLTNSFIDRLWFLCFVPLLVPVYRKLDKAMFSFAALMVLVPAISNSMMSYTRYVFMAIPVFVVVGVYFSQGERRRWLFPLIAFLFGLQMIFIIRHINSIWVA